MNETTRVAIVDDHPTVRKGVRAELERETNITVVAEAGSLAEGRRVLRNTRPDVVVLDIELEDRSGLELLDAVHGNATGRRTDTPRFICMSMHSGTREVIRGIAAGAAGFVSKNADTSELLAAVTAVVGGHSYLSADVTTTVCSWIRRLPDPEGLTYDREYNGLSQREKQVFVLLAEGASSEEIAGRLSISKKTVANYRLKIMDVLGTTSTIEMRAYAERLGLL